MDLAEEYHMKLFLALFALVMMSGCALMRPHVNLRNDAYYTTPLWTSDVFRAAPAGATVDQIDSTMPGLYGLVAQVNPESEFLGGVASVSTLGNKRNPLPSELAKLDVTRAFVEAIAAAVTGNDVHDVNLSSEDFKQFGLVALRSQLSLMQSAGPRRESLLITETSTVGGATWLSVAYKYFVSYYQGKFVDRIGGTLSKPKIGSTISNETIVGAVTVLLESITDYVALTDGSAGKIKWPIVWQEKSVGGKKKREYKTAAKKVPSLISLIHQIQKKQENEEIDPVPYVAEEIRKKGEVGMTDRKIEIISFASGIAGEASGLGADAIVRTIGGAGGAFVLFGKISIGDNDTLSKLIQSSMDTIVQRTTSLSLSTLLYDKKLGGDASAFGTAMAESVDGQLAHASPLK